MSRIKKPKKKDSKLPEKALVVNVDTNNEYPLMSFKQVCDKHCRLSDWRNDELSSLIKAFQSIESLKWADVLKHSGLRYKSNITEISLALPNCFPPDAKLSEFRVNDKCRIFGYRTGKVFNIIWFDREHMVCPENKVKRA